MVNFRNSFGYTLIEVMIVLAVIGVLAIVAFFGFGAYKNSDAVTFAQRDFLSTLRTAQNKIATGAEGVNVIAVTIPNTLPGGITTSVFPSSLVTICFVNRNVTASFACGGCSGTTGYACDGSTLSSPAKVTVTFSLNSTVKNVIIEGAGTWINRVYAQ